MSAMVVPDYVRDAINRKLDAAFEKYPQAAVDREVFYDAVLRYFDEFGELPELEFEPPQ